MEANESREGRLTTKYRRKMSQSSEKFISEAEEKMPTGRYTAQELLQIVLYVTEKPFEKNGRCEKNENIENDVFLMTSKDPTDCF